MCHAWIAHWTVARATLTMSRRRSTHDERTQGRKRARTFFWRAREPVWRLERPYSNRGARDERANQRTEYGKQTTYQIKHSQHIPVILHMRIEF